MGEVKTLRTGFLVFEPRIQVVSTARCKRARSAVLLPAQGGSRGVHGRRLPRFALELHHTKWGSSRQDGVSLVTAPRTGRACGRIWETWDEGIEACTEVTRGPGKGDPPQGCQKSL